MLSIGFPRRGRALLLAALMLSPAPCAAAAMTLDQALRAAIEQNRDLKAARAQVDAALGRLKQSGRWPNPRLELSNETDVPFGNDGEYAISAGFSQEFPIGGRLARATDLARVDVARALAEVNVAELELLSNVADTFDSLVVLDQKIALHEELIAIDTALASASRARHRVGEVSELDVNAAELERQRLVQEYSALAGERAAAIRTLAGLLGMKADAPITVDTAPPAILELPPVAELTERAMVRRPDLRLLALAADRAGAERALANASAWEDWSISLGVRQDRRVIFAAPPQPADKALMFSLSIPMPVFNDNGGAIEAASADESAAREQLAALQARVENEVAGLYEQVGRLRTAIETYRTQTLPLARRNAELARNAYRQGQVSMAEVVQAERQERDLGSAYADTLAQYLRAIEALDRATVARFALMTQTVDATSAKSAEH